MGQFTGGYELWIISNIQKKTVRPWRLHRCWWPPTLRPGDVWFNGDTPIAGWFSSWKIMENHGKSPSKTDDSRGYHDLMTWEASISQNPQISPENHGKPWKTVAACCRIRCLAQIHPLVHQVPYRFARTPTMWPCTPWPGCGRCWCWDHHPRWGQVGTVSMAHIGWWWLMNIYIYEYESAKSIANRCSSHYIILSNYV